MSGGQRPGRGGKQTRIDKTYVTDATRELIDQLGVPETVSDRGATVMIWELDAAGDGLMVARLSGDDLRKGERAFGQVHELRALAEQAQVRPRWLLVALRLSGRREYERRSDFQFLEHVVAQHGAAWVAYCNPDRIARHGFAHETFYARLQELGLELYLGSLGRKVDWERDRLYMQITGVLSEHDRNRIVTKMTTSRERMWPLAGRGWPSSYFFGLERDEHGFFRVDPVQWPFVKRVFYDYPDFREKSSGGLRGLARHLTALGCPMDRDFVHKILHDPIYVDGKWSVNVRGQRVEQRTVELADPIPRGVFEHNLALLSARGPAGRAHEGKGLLSGVPVIHEPCRHETGRDGLAVRLRPNFDYDRYYHWPRVPEQCRGWAIDRESFDEVVIEALLGLAGDPELQAAWADAAAERWPPDEAVREDELSVLSARRGNLLAQRARLVRQWIDLAAETPTETPLDAFVSATQAVDEEIAALERRIWLAESQEALRERRRRRTAVARGQLLSEMEAVLRCAPAPSAWRRRTLFVHSVLSCVIVRDTDDGVTVELQGPLVPHGYDGADPLSLLDADASDLSANQLIRRHVRSQPAWISPPLAIRIATGPGSRYWERVLALVRDADRELPLGRLWSTENLRRWRLLQEQGKLGGRSALREAPRRTEQSIHDIVLAALGTERALRMRRVPPRTPEEAEALLRMAVADGFDLRSPRWYKRFEETALRPPYLPAASTFTFHLKRHGSSLSEVRARVLA